MQQIPDWETNRFSASQKIPRILWNPKVHYRSNTCTPSVLILSQRDPVHIPISHILKIHHNNNLPSTPRSPKWSLSFRFPHQNPVYASPLPHTRYMTRPSHSSRFYQTVRKFVNIRLHSPLICTVLTYGCETWTHSKTTHIYTHTHTHTEDLLNSFEGKILSQKLGRVRENRMCSMWK